LNGSEEQSVLQWRAHSSLGGCEAGTAGSENGLSFSVRDPKSTKSNRVGTICDSLGAPAHSEGLANGAA
jgi:hypothetical protein